ncbi:MAG TPA: hypothetical protein VK821_01475 [Dehalococcoidia bacterium]|nr:hypothetical protein [Dehalococcoidia bacterium]
MRLAQHLGWLVVVVLLATPASARAVGVAGDNAPEGAARAAAYAASFRSDMGLAADPTTIAEALSNPEAYSNIRYGTPLAPSEAKTVRDLIRAQNDLTGTAEAAARLPDFTSTYFSAGTLHVLVTGDTVTAEAAIRPTVPPGRVVVVGQAQVDNRTLVETAAAIGSDPDVAAIAVPTTVAIDPVTARVEARFRPSDPLDDLTALLKKKFGNLVTVLTESATGSAIACNSRDDCGTKGGLGAHHASPSVTCTTGFVSKVNGGTLHRILTAGHCINDAGGVTNSYPWKNYLGTLTWGLNADFLYTANEDIGTFWIGSTTTYNQYFAGGTADIRTVRDTEASTAQMPVGRVVCVSGHTSGWGCGTIHRTNVSETYDGFIHYGLWEFTPLENFGDSGAGVVGLETDDSYVIPFGIAVSTGPTYTYFQPANEDSVVYTHVCTTAAC